MVESGTLPNSTFYILSTSSSNYSGNVCAIPHLRDQCDQIWRNLATLAKFYKYWAKFLRVYLVYEPTLAHLHCSEWPNIEKKFRPSGHTAWDLHISFFQISLTWIEQFHSESFKGLFLKIGPFPDSLSLTFFQNWRLQQNSNSDRRSRRRMRWPLDHPHYGPFEGLLWLHHYIPVMSPRLFSKPCHKQHLT